MPAREFRVSPLRRLVGFRVAALPFVPPLPGGRRPLTHSPRREVVSGPANTEGAHPTASGRRKEVVLFRQSYPPCPHAVALITQSYPVALKVTLSTAWVQQMSGTCWRFECERNSDHLTRSPCKVERGISEHSSDTHLMSTQLG